MYNRENVYLHHGKRVSFDWFQFTYKGQKSVVLKERYTEGPSLTNSMEGAIQYILWIMKVPVVIYQDCDDEGVFRVDYTVIGRFYQDGREGVEVGKLSWHRFSKDLTALELLYAKT